MRPSSDVRRTVYTMRKYTYGRGCGFGYSEDVSHRKEGEDEG